MPKLCPLFSGSSGNSYYLEAAGCGILIDCGRSARQIETALKSSGFDPAELKAIFITHEHIDHVSGLRVFASKYKLRVFASQGTINALAEKNLINENVNIVPIGSEGTETGTGIVKPFRISHDCAEGYGYVVETSDGRKTAFATDTGIVTEEMMNALSGCDTVVLESNHDVGMLRCGSYPFILKKRILSEVGHLSNETCAQTASALVKSGTTRLLLAHLSRENNFPELARQASLCELEKNGMRHDVDFILKVVPEANTSGAILY